MSKKVLIVSKTHKGLTNILRELKLKEVDFIIIQSTKTVNEKAVDLDLMRFVFSESNFLSKSCMKDYLDKTYIYGTTCNQLNHKVFSYQ